MSATSPCSAGETSSSRPRARSARVTCAASKRYSRKRKRRKLGSRAWLMNLLSVLRRSRRSRSSGSSCAANPQKVPTIDAHRMPPLSTISVLTSCSVRLNGEAFTSPYPTEVMVTVAQSERSRARARECRC